MWRKRHICSNNVTVFIRLLLTIYLDFCVMGDCLCLQKWQKGILILKLKILSKIIKYVCIFDIPHLSVWNRLNFYGCLVAAILILKWHRHVSTNRRISKWICEVNNNTCRKSSLSYIHFTPYLGNASSLYSSQSAVCSRSSFHLPSWMHANII